MIKAEGIEADDPETVATVRQRCTMAMYRYYDRRQVVKERRGAMRVWKGNYHLDKAGSICCYVP